MSQEKTTKLNIMTGSVTFWINEGKIVWDDNKVYSLFQVNENGNSILLLKDTDNKLKFFHVFLGYGRTDVEYDVSSLSVNERHFVAVTWDLNKKVIILYLDGKKVASSSVHYKVK